MRGSVAALKKALKWHGCSDRVNWVEVNEWIKQEQIGKTDKLGQGEVGYVHLDTLTLLQEMAVACGRDPSRAEEKIFGIGERQVWNRINAARPGI